MSRGWWLRLAWCSWAWKKEMAVGATVLLVWSVCYRSTSIQLHPNTRHWGSSHSDNHLTASRAPYGDRSLDEGASKIIKSVMDIKPVEPKISKPMKPVKKRINLKNAEIEKHIKMNKKRRVKGKKAKKGAKPKSLPAKASEHRDPNADRHDVKEVEGREAAKQADRHGGVLLRSAGNDDNNAVVNQVIDNVVPPAADQYSHPLGRNPFPRGARFDDAAIRRMPKQSDYPFNVMSSTSPAGGQSPSNAPALVVPPLSKSGTSTSAGVRAFQKELEDESSQAPERKEPEDEASFMERMKEVMTSRQARVKKACREHQSSLMRFSKYERLLWDTKHHLAYCRNAKAGTTTVLKDFLEREGVATKNLTSEAIHDVARKKFVPPKNPQEAEEELRRSVVFTVVRHPFVRLVSTYLDKFPEMYRLDVQKEIVQRYRNITYPMEDDHPPGPSYEVVHNELADDDPVHGRPRSTKDKDGAGNHGAKGKESPAGANPGEEYDVDYPGEFPTFREFALYVMDELEKCDTPVANPDCLQEIDVHWTPSFERCAPCDVQYDVIAKVESFADDMRYIKLLANLTEEAKVPLAKEHAKEGLSTDVLAQEYLEAMTMEERERLYYAFNNDFLLFGYLPNVF